MVPMAPSSTTMRSANNSQSICTLLIGGLASRVLGSIGPHAERMADGVSEFRAVQRVEMELVDAMALQGVHLLDGHRGGNELARLGVVFQPVETMLQPRGDGSS